MANVVRNPYSNTAGNTPSSLGNGVLAVNQSDGRLFYRSAAGAVTTFSSIASFATTAAFPAVGLANVLYLSSDSSRAYQFSSGVYVEVGVSGGGLADLLDGSVTNAKIQGVEANKVSGLFGFFNSSATVIDTIPRPIQNTSLTLTSGSMVLTFFTPLVTRTITQITASSGGVAGAGLTLVRFGIYTFDETTATLVAASANDTTLLTSTSTIYTRSLSTGGGLPSSYTLTAGSRYGFAALATGTTMPSIIGLNSSGFNLATITPRANGQVTSQTNLPATFVVGNIAVTTNSFCARFS